MARSPSVDVLRFREDVRADTTTRMRAAVRREPQFENEAPSKRIAVGLLRYGCLKLKGGLGRSAQFAT
eukprot:2396531-Pyramimonas_sp.AAC.1